MKNELVEKLKAVSELNTSLRKYNEEGKKYFEKHKKQIEEFQEHMKKCLDPNCICKESIL